MSPLRFIGGCMANTDEFSSQRRRLLVGATVAATAAAFPMISIGQHRIAGGGDRRYSTRAIDVVRSSMVIDMLAPLFLDFRNSVFAEPISEAKAEEFRISGITGFHHAVGLGGPSAYEDALGFIAAWSGFVGRNTHVFSLVGRAEDLDRAKAEGKAAVIIGLQNADQFRKPEDVKSFYELGLRCAQLTYNSQNFIGSGSTDRVDGGVSDFGAQIIEAMNEVGMLIDVSHCGDQTTLDAIELSPRPIAITHSNCRALNNHPRVKTDEAIRKLGANGGVMGITGVRMFVRDAEPTTIEHMADHIDHVAKLIGVEHVGIGSDADLNGYDDMPADQNKMLRGGYKSSYAFRDKLDTDGFDHPRKTYDLAEVLIKRGYSDADIGAVLGGNFRRLLGATWR